MACADATSFLGEIRELVGVTGQGQSPTFAKDLRNAAVGADVDTRATVPSPTFAIDLRNRLINETLKEIQSGRIDDYGFERLVEDLLRALGAKKVRIIRRLFH